MYFLLNTVGGFDTDSIHYNDCENC